MSEFTTPSFLQNRSVDDWYEKIEEILPDNIDLSEGSHAYNMTRPIALVAAEICEFILPDVLMLALPEWSYGEFLDGHAKGRGITRRAATAATGELTITGEPKTVIPAGSLFTTAAIDEEPSIDYETLEEAIIPESGSVTVAIQCRRTGTVGNTSANTIMLVGNKITGIASVTNPESVAGGAEGEDDDSLKARIDDYDKSQGESYTGSVADYKRWAMSVPGVGNATVIPAKDDTGLVTIIITDANGAPATESLCKAVYNHIMAPEDEGSRLANVNAFLSVVAPSTTAIGVKATVELEVDATLESVRTAFLAQLALYLPTALEQGEVKLSRVGAALSGTKGINDLDSASLQIGVKLGETITYGTSNIPITTNQLPTVVEADLILTEGTV